MQPFKILILATVVLSSCQRSSDATDVKSLDSGTDSQAIIERPVNGIQVSGPALEMGNAQVNANGMNLSIDKSNWSEGKAYVVSVSQEMVNGDLGGAHLAIFCGEKKFAEISPSAGQSSVALLAQFPAGACSAKEFKYEVEGIAASALGKLSVMILELGEQF